MNASEQVFNAMCNGRRISLMNSQEFKVSQMHTTICKIRKRIYDQGLPWVMRNEWARTANNVRMKVYWLEAL